MTFLMIFFLHFGWAQEQTSKNLLRPLMREKKIISVDVSGTKTYKAFHRNCLWQNIQANDAKIDALTLRNCQINNSSFQKSTLRNLTTIQSQWRDVDFRGTDLRGAYWSRSSCQNCDFRGANLLDVTFVVVDLRGSKVDAKTKLPFSEQEAVQRGLSYVE